MKLSNSLPFNQFKANIQCYEFAIRKCFFSLILLAAVASLIACSKPSDIEIENTLIVEIRINNKPLECNRFNRSAYNWKIEQFAFFLSNFRLYAQDKVTSLLLEGNDWQTETVTLIKPEISNCEQPKEKAEPLLERATNTNLKSNSTVRFMPNKESSVLDAEAISFTLGVPFIDNHQNPLTQESPLNLPSMFWSWRSGHKFFRLDMQSENQNWLFHMGSVGCESASTMRSPKTGCLEPNRIDFRLDKKQPDAKLVFHLDRLLEDISLQRTNSCLFHGEQQSCEVLMNNFSTKQVFEWH